MEDTRSRLLLWGILVLIPSVFLLFVSGFWRPPVSEKDVSVSSSEIGYFKLEFGNYTVAPDYQRITTYIAVPNELTYTLRDGNDNKIDSKVVTLIESDFAQLVKTYQDAGLGPIEFVSCFDCTGGSTLHVSVKSLSGEEILSGSIYLCAGNTCGDIKGDIDTFKNMLIAYVEEGPPSEQPGCGDSVCTRTELQDGSCPEDCEGVSLLCPQDTFQCPDGSYLFRDPALDCQFPGCPEESTSQCGDGQCDADENCRNCSGDCGTCPGLEICASIVIGCPDGSLVSPDPNNNCAIPECPGLGGVVCKEVPKECADGSVVMPDPNNNCEYPACPEDGATCTLPPKECPDGTMVSIIPGTCTYAECPPIVVCSLTVIECPDGSTVAPDPNNDCKIPQCPYTAQDGCKGDYDQDGIVAISDLSVFAKNYKQTGIDCTLELAGDNCYIDIVDLQAFALVYKQENVCKSVQLLLPL